MMRAVLFDQFSSQCQFFDSDLDANNGYGCSHKEQREKTKEGHGCCYCHTCPLGIEAEQEDLTEPEHPDAIKDNIDWDGLCEDGEVTEGEYLLVEIGEEATLDQKEAICNYDAYMHRYDE